MGVVETTGNAVADVEAVAGVGERGGIEGGCGWTWGGVGEVDGGGVWSLGVAWVWVWRWDGEGGCLWNECGRV